MKEYLNKVRKSNDEINLKRKIFNTCAILFFGIVLGIFAKWLDNLSINDEIVWQRILGMLDLGNVFSEFGVWIFLAVLVAVFSKSPKRASLNVFAFLIGMTTSYHLYTVLFSGFNPKRYMLIWYGMTLFSPVLAYICWYAKGNGWISTLIAGGILSVMMLCSFSVGLWYFGFRSAIHTILFIGTVLVLHVKVDQTIKSLIVCTGLVIIFRLLI